MANTIYQNQTPATHQALGLVVNWFFETPGGETKQFGPEEPLTQEIINDSGVTEFSEKWAEAGYEVPFSMDHQADERSSGTLPSRVVNGAGVFVREHVVELGLSVFGFAPDDPKSSIDAVGGTIGSLDRISVSATQDGQLRFEVYNVMGWSSGTRIPGTNTSILKDQPRTQPGPGGTTYQLFYWYEQYPDDMPR